LRVTHEGRSFTVDVTADGEGLVSHAGAALLAETGDRVGLTRALSRGLAGVRERRGRHDPGRVIRDLAVMLADGGDCLSDLRAVRDQQPLFGPVASDTTAFRLIDRIASDPALLEALRAARARARARAWELGARPQRIVIDVDATLIGAHTEKEGAAVNFKGTFGFHPLLAYLDESREALAGMLRPGNAAAHSAADQIAVLDEALEQLPRPVVADPNSEIVLRTDSAGAALELCQAARDAKIGYLVGFDLTKQVRRAILSLPESAWRPALHQDGRERDGAQVAEITELLNFYDWPERSRVIVRRERPHPGAQLSFTDVDGHRFQATLTDPARQRGRARAPAPRSRQRRGPRPSRQADRTRQPPVPRVRAQRRLAGTVADRPRPQRLDTGAVPERRAGQLRTQDAALPAPAHRRPACLPRPPGQAAPPSKLALGRSARRRVRTPPSAPATRRLMTGPAASEDHTPDRRAPRPAAAVAQTRQPGRISPHRAPPAAPPRRPIDTHPPTQQRALKQLHTRP
jgi:DDE family transposase